MNSYQPIYDAMHSKISGCDISDAITRAIWDQNWSHYIEGAFSVIAEESTQPHVLMRPSLSIDGNQWCALYGDDLQNGVVGFGDSPLEAISAFNKAWWAKLTTDEDKQ